MIRIILNRIAISIPILLIVITVTFFFIRLAPGGPFDTEKAVPREIKENLEKYYNLDKPVFTQYLDYLKNLVQGDFGPSFKHSNRTVTEMILTGLPVTFELGLYALLIAIFIGIIAGLMAALMPNTFQDYIPMSLAMTGICIPTLLLGPLLVLIFGIWFEWLPVSGWNTLPGDKILPSITMGTVYAAYIARLTRGGMLEIMYQDFIRTARAKGFSK